MTLTEETLRFVAEHRHDDVRTLALQAARYPHVDMPVALTQIAGWQAAEEKIPTWAATDGSAILKTRGSILSVPSLFSYAFTSAAIILVF